MESKQSTKQFIEFSSSHDVDALIRMIASDYAEFFFKFDSNMFSIKSCCKPNDKKPSDIAIKTLCEDLRACYESKKSVYYFVKYSSASDTFMLKAFAKDIYENYGVTNTSPMIPSATNKQSIDTQTKEDEQKEKQEQYEKLIEARREKIIARYNSRRAALDKNLEAKLKEIEEAHQNSINNLYKAHQYQINLLEKDKKYDLDHIKVCIDDNDVSRHVIRLITPFMFI